MRGAVTTHNTSSPRHAQSNGFIERQIRYLKPIIKKCLKSGGDIELALLNVRATPLDSVLPSPAELMFGRPIQTTMPSRSSIIEKEEIRNHIKESTNAQKSYGDHHTKDLPPILSGKSVRVQDKERKTWFRGTVLSPCTNKERAYLVETEGGRQLIRNRVQLREVPDIPKHEMTPHTPLRTPSQHPVEAPWQIPSTEKDVHTPVKGDVQQMDYGHTARRSGRTVSKPTRLVEVI